MRNYPWEGSRRIGSQCLYGEKKKKKVSFQDFIYVAKSGFRIHKVFPVYLSSMITYRYFSVVLCRKGKIKGLTVFSGNRHFI